MCLKGGKELLFQIDAKPDSIEGWTEGIYLKYLEMDENGSKMEGDFPILWENVNDEIIGPDLYDDDHQYKVMKVDYNNGLIWLYNLDIEP